MNKSKVVTPPKQNRDEIAREALKQQMFQTRRRFEELRETISQNEGIIEINKAKQINLKSQLGAGEITEKDQEGKLATKEMVNNRLLSLKHHLETDERKTIYLKEDLMNLMKNRDIKAYEEEIKKVYQEVEEFYTKNFK